MAIGGALAGGIGAALSGGNILHGIVFGALSAAVAGAIFGSVNISAELQTATNLVAQGFIGGIRSVVEGGDFGIGFLVAGAGALIGSSMGLSSNSSTRELVGGAIASAIIGGGLSVLGGGKFWNGAATSAFAYLATNMVQSRKKKTLTVKLIPDQVDLTPEQREAMFNQTIDKLRSNGLIPDNAEIVPTGKYVAEGPNGLFEIENQSFRGQIIAAQNGYSAVLGQAIPSGWFDFFGRYRFEVYNAAFYAIVSPLGEPLSARQTLSFTIGHELGHTYGPSGCRGGSSAAEACANGFARAYGY